MQADRTSKGQTPANTARPLTAGHDDTGGLVPALLITLTTVTGMVDAVSYLKLGHIFVANMTGNIVFLGFALTGAGGLSITSSLISLAAFLVGAVAGGRLGTWLGMQQRKLLTSAIMIEAALVAVALVISAATGNQVSGGVLDAMIVFLALSMGLQNATARRLGVRDLTTTVLTLTITGLAADSRLAGGKNQQFGRRLMAVTAMLVGAAVGGVLVLHVAVSASLGLATTVLLIAGLASLRASFPAMPEAHAPIPESHAASGDLLRPGQDHDADVRPGL